MKNLIGVLVVVAVLCCVGVSFLEAADLTVPNPDMSKKPIEPPTGTITMVPGWNLVSIPVIPASPLTVESFMALVASNDYMPIGMKRQNTPPEFITRWEVVVVAVYKNGKFAKYPKEGRTYNMVPGEAYFVYVEYRGGPIACDEYGRFCVSVNITGKPENETISMNLRRGWNGVSIKKREKRDHGDDQIRGVKDPIIPFIKTDVAMSLSQLSKELAEQGVKANRIAFWKSSTQEWEQYDLPYLVKPPELYPVGIMQMDRLISSSEGFFLLCEENGLYVPGMKSAVSTPIPDRQVITGQVHGVGYIPESRPPYNYRLVYFTPAEYPNPLMQGGTMIQHELGLIGIDEAMNARLALYGKSEEKYSVTVYGAVKKVTYDTMLPPYTASAEVMSVDTMVTDVELTSVTGIMEKKEESPYAYWIGRVALEASSDIIAGALESAIAEGGQHTVIGTTGLYVAGNVSYQVITVTYIERSDGTTL